MNLSKIALAVPAVVWLLVSAAFFASGEFLSKKWGMHPSPVATAQVIVAYACSTLFWLPALLHKNQLAVMGTAWLLLATVATVTIGVAVFHETLGVRQLAGVVLSLGAFILLA